MESLSVKWQLYLNACASRLAKAVRERQRLFDTAWVALHKKDVYHVASLSLPPRGVPGLRCLSKRLRNSLPLLYVHPNVCRRLYKRVLQKRRTLDAKTPSRARTKGCASSSKTRLATAFQGVQGVRFALALIISVASTTIAELVDPYYQEKWIFGSIAATLPRPVPVSFADVPRQGIFLLSWCGQPLRVSTYEMFNTKVEKYPQAELCIMVSAGKPFTIVRVYLRCRAGMMRDEAGHTHDKDAAGPAPTLSPPLAPPPQPSSTSSLSPDALVTDAPLVVEHPATPYAPLLLPHSAPQRPAAGCR